VVIKSQDPYLQPTRANETDATTRGRSQGKKTHHMLPLYEIQSQQALDGGHLGDQSNRWRAHWGLVGELVGMIRGPHIICSLHKNSLNYTLKVCVFF
jgi:hypothetical protein